MAATSTNACRQKQTDRQTDRQTHTNPVAQAVGALEQADMKRRQAAARPQRLTSLPLVYCITSRTRDVMRPQRQLLRSAAAPHQPQGKPLLEPILQAFLPSILQAFHPSSSLTRFASRCFLFFSCCCSTRTSCARPLQGTAPCIPQTQHQPVRVSHARARNTCRALTPSAVNCARRLLSRCRDEA